MTGPGQIQGSSVLLTAKLGSMGVEAATKTILKDRSCDAAIMAGSVGCLGESAMPGQNRMVCWHGNVA